MDFTRVMADKKFRTSTSLLGKRLNSPVFKTQMAMKRWMNIVGDARENINQGQPVTAVQRSILERSNFNVALVGDILVRELTGKYLEWLADNYADNTVKTYFDNIKAKVLPEFGDTSVYQIKKSDVSNWLDRIGGSEAKQRNARVALSQIIEYGVEKGDLPEDFKNPAKYIRRKGKRKARGRDKYRFYESKQDIETLLVGCKMRRKRAETEAEIARRYVFAMLGVNCGLRKSEALGLAWSRIDWESSSVEISHVLVQATGKVDERTKKGEKCSRDVPVPKSVMNALTWLHSVAQHNTEDDLVISRDDGSPYSPSQILHEIRCVCKQMGIKYKGVQALRHTYGSHYIMAGGRVEDLKELMGHEEINTTMIYVHLTKEFIKKRPVLISFGGTK